MKMHLRTALCCALVLSAGNATSAETSLLDRLAEESIIGDGSNVPSPPPRVSLSASPSAKQLDELKLQLKEALGQKQEMEAELALLRASATQPSKPGAASSKEPGASEGETAALRQQIADLLAQIQHLTQQGQDQDKALADLHAVNQQLQDKQNRPPAGGERSDAGSARRIIDAKASKDARVSYALGAWYGDSASYETQKLRSIDKTLDVQAFAQGFNDKLNNAMQLPKDKVAAELASVEKQLDAAMLSSNQKISKTLLAEASKEKGAVKMADGSVYRIMEKGKAPFVTAQSDILLEIEERLGTGELLAPAASTGNKVSDLPPAFQTVVTQLGLGGTAKFHIPSELMKGEQGYTGGVPPGMVVVMTLKIAGVK
ncbi:FKBP-type peptidyl-prolyl cis-trans isomerase N-terminal domain-containing protein [Pseudomonas aeruginosa]